MDAISCLPPPAALLATSFADAAIARALHLSISSADSLSQPAAYCHAPPTPHSDSVLVADSPTAGRRHHKQQYLAPAGGRAGKRRSRASKRAPTTYISTDPANFRIMVQHITGAQADIDIDVPVLMAAADASAATGTPLQLPVPEAALHPQQQPCFPTLDSWNVMYERTDLL